MSEEITVTDKKMKDDRTLAAIAHFSVAAALLLGPLAVVIPLLIWLIQRDKQEPSALLLFHGKQAFFYQLACLLAGAILAGIASAFSIIFIGVLLMPIIVLLGLAAIAYGIYGGVQVYQGKDFRYKYVADFIEAGEKPK
jgi:uncharacterized Tic20 family protein